MKSLLLDPDKEGLIWGEQCRIVGPDVLHYDHLNNIRPIPRLILSNGVKCGKVPLVHGNRKSNLCHVFILGNKRKKLEKTLTFVCRYDTMQYYATGGRLK